MYNGFLQACNGLFSFGKYHFGGYIGMIIGLVLLVVVLFLVFKKGSLLSDHKGMDSPLENLQKRFVNGEIDKDEYLEKKKILENL